MPPRVLLSPILLLALVATPTWAQDNTVIQAENVRYAYAQVLRVSPVYQTLTATRIEQRCDQSPRPADENSRLSRMVGAFKDALSRERAEAEAEANCRAVSVEREFHRPIAYDVDYVYKGAKYRSRLPDDPGNRLRIRIGVTPVVSGSRSR
jgi:uncharacterized protein YcfJ